MLVQLGNEGIRDLSDHPGFPESLAKSVELAQMGLLVFLDGLDYLDNLVRLGNLVQLAKKDQMESEELVGILAKKGFLEKLGIQDRWVMLDFLEKPVGPEKRVKSVSKDQMVKMANKSWADI